MDGQYFRELEAEEKAAVINRDLKQRKKASPMGEVNPQINQ